MSNSFQREPTDPSVMYMPKAACPACGYKQDAVSRPLGQPMHAPPKDGDYCVCFQCGEVLIFSVSAFGVAVREATTEEIRAFAENPRNTRYVQALHAFHAKRHGGS